MTSRHRVLHISRDLDYIGGTETFLKALFKEAMRNGDDIHLASLGAETSRSAENTIPIHHIIAGESIKSIMELKAIMSALKPDVVHTHLVWPDLYGGIAARMSHIPSLSTKYSLDLRGYETSDRRERWVIKPLSDRVLQPAVAYLPHELVGVSKGVQDVYRNLPKLKMTVIPCTPISSPFLFPTESEANSARASLGIGITGRIIGTIARLVPEKDLDLFLDMADILRHYDSELAFVIIGGGPLERQLKEKIARLGLQKRVILTGELQDPLPMASNFDVFVLTSASEGLGIAVLEAMAMGIPVVTTDVGGLAEFVTEGGGLTVSSRSPDCISRTVVRAMTDEEFRSGAAILGPQLIASRFDLRAAYRKLVQVYDRIVNNQ